MNISQFFDLLVGSFDWWIVLLVLCSGFFQKKYFQGFRWASNDSYDSALKTLALSFFVSVVYILLMRDPGEEKNWSRFFVSYFFATSLYELLVDPFIKWVKKFAGGGADQ